MGSRRSPAKAVRGELRSATRVSNRVHPSVPGLVNFIAGKIEGSGLILDVSVTGAYVHGASHRLEAGTRVDMYFLQAKTARRLHAIADVVRETESGFAVEFLRVERELRRLVLSAVEKTKKPTE